MDKNKLIALFAPAFIVLGLDQLSKWIIRTTPELQHKTLIDGWLEFYFVKNEGMAMGINLLPTWLISVIAISATIGILIYLFKNLNRSKMSFLIFMGLILGGAMGNISDRLFMGYVYGYGGVLEGHVVDFIHFNLKIADKPVFPYIFNVADIAISISIVTLLVFSRRLLVNEQPQIAHSDESVAEVVDLD